MDKRLPDHNFHNECLRNYKVSVHNLFRCNLNITSFSFFWERIRLSLNTIHTAKRVIKMPWPKSPNITANRKGKVMMVYGAIKKNKEKDKVQKTAATPHRSYSPPYSKINIRWPIPKLVFRRTPEKIFHCRICIPPRSSSDGIWATAGISNKEHRKWKSCLEPWQQRGWFFLFSNPQDTALGQASFLLLCSNQLNKATG